MSDDTEVVPAPTAPRFVREGLNRPAEHGIEWLKRGWTLFRRAPLTWVGIMVALIVLNIVANVVPVIGGLAMALLFPVFTGGLMVGCHALAQGQTLDFACLFAGFAKHAARLVVVGAVSLAGTLAAMTLMFLALGGTVFSAIVGASDTPPVVPPSAGLLGMLIGLGVMVPVYMAIWFAPVLIVLEEAPAIGALRASFAACRKNLVGFLVYGLVLLILAVLATLPLGLGWLVLGPVAVGSVYGAYRDLYFEA